MKISQTKNGSTVVTLASVKRARRSYAAGLQDRLVEDWFSNSNTADENVRRDLVTIRNRARAMERDSDHVKSLLRLIVANVLGPNGIRLSMRLKRRNGKLKANENEAIHEQWERWGMFRTCTYDRRNTWRGVQRIVLQSVVRDGAAFVWKMRDMENPFRFSVYPVEYDFLDHTLIREEKSGNRIQNGIELDSRNRQVAYWFWKYHPGDPFRHDQAHIRAPASDVIHVYRQDRIGQNLGVTWFSSGMRALNMLDGYREAELTAARVAACKAGFFKPADPQGMAGPDDGSEDELTTDLAPGQWETLPRGWDVVPYDPNHPNTAYGDFEKANLRSFAAGAGVNYNELARDYEGVNYSSLRAAALSDRDYYRELQAWFAEQLHAEVFAAWFPMAEITGAVSFAGSTEFEAINCACHWRPRGWQWVDPQKEIAAAVQAMQNRIESRQEVIGRTGRTMEEVDSEIDADENFPKQMELKPQMDANNEEEGMTDAD